METSKLWSPMGCTTRTAWFDGCNGSWLLPPGTFRKRCWLETAAVPPTGATTSQSGPGKLLDSGAAGTAGTGPAAKPDCTPATMPNKPKIAKKYCDLFLYMHITPRYFVPPNLRPCAETSGYQCLISSAPPLATITNGVHYPSYNTCVRDEDKVPRLPRSPAEEIGANGVPNLCRR